VAGEYVSRATPDGYTLLYANTSVLAVNPALQGANMPYDPRCVRADRLRLQLAAAAGRQPQAALPDRAAIDRLGKGQSGQAELRYRRVGPCRTSPSNVQDGNRNRCAERSVFGGGPALTAVISGQADVCSTCTVRGENGRGARHRHHRRERHPDLPDVPTLAESGYPAVTSTPGPESSRRRNLQEIVHLLNGKLNELIQRPDTQQG